LAGRRLEKQMTVTDGPASISPARVGSWWTVLYPAEPPIPAGIGIERIEVEYPAASLGIFEVHIP
jgi:hypothetical protein